MIKIKLSHNSIGWPLLRQTPGEKGVIGEYEFFLNNQNHDYDYWVVLENLPVPKESNKCKKDNTILITAEPPSVKSYNKKFMAQFGLVVTCHKKIKHLDKFITQTGLPWHVGRKQKEHQNNLFTKNYDELKKIEKYPKEKLLSIVVSNKSFTKGHKKRLKFAKALKEHFGSQLEFFGRGFNEIEDKWDAIFNYKYHIVLENSIYEDYWTEKLADAYLAGAFPFYSGCPNLANYFSEKAFCFIDINNIPKAISIIENSICNQLYEKSISYLKIAKEDILDKYNLFPLIVSAIESKMLDHKEDHSISRITLFQEPKPSFFSKAIRKVKNL